MTVVVPDNDSFQRWVEGFGGNVSDPGSLMGGEWDDRWAEVYPYFCTPRSSAPNGVLLTMKDRSRPRESVDQLFDGRDDFGRDDEEVEPRELDASARFETGVDAPYERFVQWNCRQRTLYVPSHWYEAGQETDAKEQMGRGRSSEGTCRSGRPCLVRRSKSSRTCPYVFPRISSKDAIADGIRADCPEADVGYDRGLERVELGSCKEPTAGRRRPRQPVQ